MFSLEIFFASVRFIRQNILFKRQHNLCFSVSSWTSLSLTLLFILLLKTLILVTIQVHTLYSHGMLIVFPAEAALNSIVPYRLTHEPKLTAMRGYCKLWRLRCFSSQQTDSVLMEFSEPQKTPQKKLLFTRKLNISCINVPMCSDWSDCHHVPTAYNQQTLPVSRHQTLKDFLFLTDRKSFEMWT